jgi:hypothetical protein
MVENMDKKQPDFKASDDSHTCDADYKPFSAEMLKGYPHADNDEQGQRKGFTKRAYITPCGMPKFGKGLAG